MASIENIHISNSDSGSTEFEHDSCFPEQRHAGKVGFGPNFHVGPVCVLLVIFTETLTEEKLDARRKGSRIQKRTQRKYHA